METFEIIMREEDEYGDWEDKHHYIRTEASKNQVEQSVNFAKLGGEPDIPKLLQVLRALGVKATQVKVDPQASFRL